VTLVVDGQAYVSQHVGDVSWGGEFFVGTIAEGFARIAHLRPAVLPGGDAAARHPAQAAAGFLSQLDYPLDVSSPPVRIFATVSGC